MRNSYIFLLSQNCFKTEVSLKMSTECKVKDEIKQGFTAMEQMTKKYQIFVYGLNLTNDFPSP